MVVLLMLVATAGRLTSPAAAVVADPELKLLAADGVLGDRFGWSVAATDSLIVVGAPYDTNGNGARAGAVYLFRSDGADGYIESKLIASDGAADDRFGWSVAADGDTIVVGAPLADTAGTDAGAVYRYRSDGQGDLIETKLTATGGGADQRFGHAVAVSGANVAVAAHRWDYRTGGTGTAYLYLPDGQGAMAETVLASNSGFSAFGYSIALSGPTVLVGAPWDDDVALGAGAVHRYQPDGQGGHSEMVITRVDGKPEDLFGRAVAADGDLFVVGGFDGGTYRYQPNGAGGLDEIDLGWNQGASLALHGDLVVAGAPFATYQGRTNLADLSAGSSTGFEAAAGDDGDRYGWSVAVSDAVMVVGAPMDDRNGTDAGAVFVYQLSPDPVFCGGEAVTVDLNLGQVPTEGDDVIFGTLGDDVIDGLGGDDIICARAGADTVVGGDGNDTINGGNGVDAITGGDGNDTLNGGGGPDLISGNSGDDVIDGGGGNDRVFGGSGDDTISGGGGADNLGGGSGLDTVLGQDGNDTLTGGSADDVIVSGGPGNDAVNGGGGDDGAVNGDDGDDVVSGNGGKDVLDGGPGNDQLRGGNNDDTLYGGPGDDFVAGNDGVDTCDGGTADEVNGDTAASSCESALNIP
jgi:Ca2+-binding RTX toxin-like protein